jgi:two-component system, NarL family, sensor histidine kinase DesK
MVRVWSWWRERSGPERFDASLRWPLYLLSGAEPLVALLVVFGQPQTRGPGAAAFLLVSVLHAAACVALLRSGLAAYLGEHRPGTRLVALAAGLTAAGVLAGAAAFPTFTRTPGDEFPVSLGVVMLLGGALTAALAPLLRVPGLLGAVLLGAAAAAGLNAATGARDLPSLAGPAALYTYSVGVLAITCRWSVWMLGVVWELDRSRAVQARLAVAEERLRFARDLHDVLGRNLTLVAIQGELAARLAARGEDGAVKHMLDVRQIAQDSLREMRAVVGGYRSAGLDSELAGAQSVLRSAGVSCRVIGDGTGLPRAAQAALGWVVREATTNVIRHSDATACTIELDIVDGPGNGRTAVLRMENDGVRRPGAGSSSGSGGSGLAGLGERLAGLGGTLTVEERRGGRFVLQARLPAATRDAAAEAAEAAEAAP